MHALLERLRKECQEEKTAAGAAGSEGGVRGKLKFSSSSDTPEGDAGSSEPDALADILAATSQIFESCALCTHCHNRPYHMPETSLRPIH